MKLEPLGEYSRFKNIPSPAFICEFSKLERNLQKLDYIQNKSGAKILVALKACSFPATFPLLKKYLAGCCASGIYEAKLGKELGKEIHTFSPAFKDSEIDEIIELSDHIVFNSIKQWKKYKNKVLAKNIKCSLRINPEISTVETEIYNPCVKYSRFGITIKELEKEYFNDNTVLDGITGIHFHALCKQNFDALEIVLDKVEKNFEKYLHKVTEVNFGGGHALTEDDYNVEMLITKIKYLKKKYALKDIYLELGEAIYYDTGILMGEVVDTHYNEMNLAILDISSSAHMIDILEMPYRPNIVGADLPNKKEFTYRLGGNTCLSGDVMGDFSFDYQLKTGDKVIIEDSIHYSFVKSNFFNGVVHPNLYVEDLHGNVVLAKEYKYSDFRERLGN